MQEVAEVSPLRLVVDRLVPMDAVDRLTVEEPTSNVIWYRWSQSRAGSLQLQASLAAMVSGVDRSLRGREMKSALGKARLILGSFSFEDTELSLAELVRRTGVPKTTVYRLCAELVELGFIERVGSRYRLGIALFELGQQVPRQRILYDLALPHLEQLFQRTGETLHLGIREGLHVLYIAKIDTSQRKIRWSRLGGRLPLYCTATGKVLLAYAAPSLVDEVVTIGMPRRTQYTITSRRRLVRELEVVRARGMAVEREELRLGYLSVAAPIVSSDGSVVGAIAVTAPTSRADEARFSSAARATASAISERLARPSDDAIRSTS